RDLRSRHRAQGAVLVADGGTAIVVERPARLERLQQTGNLVGQEAGDETAEVVGMRADVAEAARGAGTLRIGAPVRLFLAAGVRWGGLQARAQPALQVRSTDGVDLAQLARQDHVARLAYERIAGVVVRDGEDDAGLLDDPGQFLSLGEVKGHRLVADDVEAG